MPGINNAEPPSKKPDWFDRLPNETGAMLLALLMFVVSAVTFLLGWHGMRAGDPLVNMAGKSDWSDSFMISAGSFVLGAALLAVALGWIKFPRANDAGTPPRK